MDHKIRLALLCTSGFVRKATYWSEVGLPINPELLIGLERHSSKELGIQAKVGADFKKNMDDTFLLEHEGGLYLVNTEGSKYARYIRYIGQAPDIVELDDEHKQPIQILFLRNKFYWVFLNWPEGTEECLNGGFSTRVEAIEDAQDYVDEGAPAQ